MQLNVTFCSKTRTYIYGVYRNIYYFYSLFSMKIYNTKLYNMKTFTKTLLFTILLTLFSQIGWGQTQIHVVDFESAGGYTTSIIERTDNSEDYFIRTDGSNISGTYNSPQGLYFFAAQDLDADGMSSPAVLTIDDVNISGYTSLELRVYVAEDDDGSNQDWDDDDYLHIDYDIDNTGTFTNGIWIENSGGTNTAPFIDTDYNGVGDGPEITDLFAQFTKSFTGTGSLIDIKVTFGKLTQGDVDIAIDHIEIWGTATSLNDTDSQVSSSAILTEPLTLSSTVTAANGIQVFDFTFTDAASGDLLATIIDQLQITQGSVNGVTDWTNAIAGAVLNGLDQTDMVGTVNATNITFAANDMISIADGGNETYTLSIWLNTDLSAITDNDVLEFAMDYTNITEDAAGSAFGVGAPESGDANVAIDIVATELKFIQQPSDTEVNAVMSPDPTVKACDTNGNIDTDYSTAISVSSDGTMTGDPVAGFWTTGLATFSGLTHTVEETGRTLTASSGALTDEDSGNFDITAVPTASADDIIISEMCDPLNNYADNRYIEIFNPTGSNIDLTGCKVIAVANGSDVFTWNLSGTINSCEALTCGDDASTVTHNFSSATWTTSNGSWNGGTNDGAYFENSSAVTIDQASTPTAYANSSIIRNPDISTPNTTFTTAEWTVTSVTDAGSGASTPGAHTNDGCSSTNDTDSEASIPTGGQQVTGNISSLDDTDPEAVTVFKFDIDDTDSGDTEDTKVTNVRIKPHSTNNADWTDHIQDIKLSGGTLGAITITTTTITDTYIDLAITSGNLDVPNSTSETMTMSLYLNTSNIVDGATLSFMVDADDHGFTADGTGSTFAGTFVGGDFNSADFTITVVATELQFVQQPSNTEVNAAMSPDPTVKACDANGNVDIDYSTAIEVASDGTMTGNPVAGSWTAGIATFASLTHTVEQTGRTLTASSPGLTDGTSANIDITAVPTSPTAWINEIHYDDATKDSNEGIEIVIENSGSYTLSDFRVDLYNGNDNSSYDDETLDNFIVGATVGTATIYTWAPSSIQNGAPDGMALSHSGILIQFLSYEGTFTGSEGVANGVLSTDIGVSESGSTLSSESLQLSGTGCAYEDFTWQTPAVNTMGAENNSQTLCGGSGPAIDIAGTDPTSDDFIQNSTDNILYQIEVAVAGGTDQEVSQIQFDAVSTLADLDALVSGYTLYYSTDATLDGGDSNIGTLASTATTNQANILYDFSASPVTITSGNAGYFFITTSVLLTANVGSTVQATNVDATYTTAGAATNTENYAVGNAHTIVLLINTESDIITAGNEAATVSSIENTAGPLASTEGIQVWEVTIRDGGAGNDSDTQPTIVEGIIFASPSGNTMDDWSEAILSCDIFDGTTHLGQAIVISNQIQFTGSPLISVPDDGSITLTVRLSISTSPNLSGTNNDGEDFVFQISQSNVTASASGSGFASFPPINSANSSNVFEVIATDFNYSVIPTAVNIATNFTIETEAVDINGNCDLDYTSLVTLSKNAGAGTLSSVTGLAQNFVLGVFQWADIQMDTQGIFSILASDGGTLNNTVSPDINAIDVIWYQGFQNPDLPKDDWTYTLPTGDSYESNDSGVDLTPTDGWSLHMDGGDELLMDAADISGYTDVSFSFAFAALNANSGHEINLRVSYDGGTVWENIEYGDCDCIADGHSGATYDFGETNPDDPYHPTNPFILTIDDTKKSFMAEISTGNTYYIDDVQLIGYLEPLTITTLNYMGATTTTAIVNAELEYTGGEIVTERGIVYALNTLPETTDNIVIDGSTTRGYFTANLSGLTAATTYYTRAYVTTSESGTVYGNELSFTTCNLTEDCLNNTDLMITEYIESSGGGGENNAIEIFNQVGSPVNLKHYRLQHDDDPIPGYDDYSMTYYDFGDVILSNGETFVIAYDQASAPELQLKAAGGFADVETAMLAIGGNEQFQLAKINGDGTAYVAFEHVGYEANFGEQKTFARRSEVINPRLEIIPDDQNCDPNINGEWIVYPDNYYGGLGIHRLVLDWQGDESSDWFTTGNWELDRVPTPSITVKITNVAGSQPIISDNVLDSAKVQDLIIESGAAFTIASDGEMTVSGKITNNGSASDLVIKSDATSTGSLIQGNGAVTAIVERFLTGDQWHYMFPPLSSTASSVYTDEGGTPNPNYYVYDETTLDYWNATTTFETTGWTSGQANLETDKGFIFNRIGLADKVYSQTGGNLFAGQKDFTVTYNTHTGTIDASCLQDWVNYDGWNLVGNPYTSAIDWDEIDLNYVLNISGIEAGIYYFDGINYKYYIQGGDGSQNPSYPIAGLNVNGGSQFIPAGQGFMVKAANSGVGTTSFSIPKLAREHNSQIFWKKSTQDIIPNLIRLEIEKDGFVDETAIRTLPVESEVTEEHDGAYDAYKMFAWNNERPQLFTANEMYTSIFAINSIPEFTENKIITLGVYVGVSGSHSINMTESNFENMHIWLEDATIGENVNLLSQAAYTFTQAAEENHDRFFLHLDLNSTPIVNIEPEDQETVINELYSFDLPENVFIDNDFEDELTLSASLASGDELPTWLSFDADLMQFSGIPDALQSIDIKLSATDIFGLEVSDVFNLNVKNAVSVSVLNEQAVSVYPNPTDGIFIIQTKFDNTNGIVSVSNIEGKVLIQKNISSDLFEVDLSDCSSGVYLIEIKINNTVVRKRIIKN